MTGYVTLGTNDITKAAVFYDALFELPGHKRMMEEYSFIAWGDYESEAAGLGVAKPNDGKAATSGNGTMVALKCASNDLVDRVYAKAIEMGGTDEGAPGPRAMPGFYAGYFRDPDGNKLNISHFDTSHMK